MTLPEFALRYKDCTKEELVQFVRQRTGNLRRNPKRSTCFTKLKQLDREVTFRFLDLAPELRNLVYEKLLCSNKERAIVKEAVGPAKLKGYTPPSPSTAYPALLRACRQVHKKARGILYDQSVYTTDMSRFEYGCGFPYLLDDPDDLPSDARPDYKPNDSAKVRGAKCREFHHRIQERNRRIEKRAREALNNPDLFRPLQDFRHLTFNIHYYSGHGVEKYKNYYQALITTFDANNPLTTLKLIWAWHYFRLDLVDGMKDEFAPLSALPAATKLEFAAFPAEAEEQLRKAIGRTSG